MNTKNNLLFGSSIKNKMFRYLSVFTVCVVAILWLFQIVLLKPFYQANIVRNFRTTSSGIQENLDNDDLIYLMEQYAMDCDFSFRVVSLDDASFDWTVNSRGPDRYLSELRDYDLYKLYMHALEHNGTYTTVIEKERMVIDNYDPDDFMGRVPQIGRENVDSIIFSRVLEKNGVEYLFIGYSQLTPVDPVTNTLKQQFVFVSLLFVGMAALFAVFMSKKISDPIVAINESAKTLATGNYDVRFMGEGYSEISELSGTLNYASGELKKVDELQRELIANISHDLRTPLTMISGYAEMMRDIPEERTEENLDIIVSETGRLSGLVNDVVDLSKYNAKADSLRYEEFSLTELLKVTLDHYDKMYQNYYQFKFDYDEDVTVVADKLKISQVIYNLLNNAVNYSKDSSLIEIRQAFAENKVAVSISNHGETIPAEEIEHLFERYYRSSSNHVRATAGSGLGLSIVKGIITLHGGSCNAESDNGYTTFSFEIPTRK